jgi:hypothetical protein
MHYNGWWLFGLPLTLLEEAGLPLPCSSRGDDVEYGLRLHAAVRRPSRGPASRSGTNPFTSKFNGWQLYYETRNHLVAAALHMPRPAYRLAVHVLKQVLMQRLTNRYGAALVLRVEDYLRGQAVRGDPRALHASSSRREGRFRAARDVARDAVTPKARLPRDPRGRAAPPRASPGRSRATGPCRRAPGRQCRCRRDLVWFRVAGSTKWSPIPVGHAPSAFDRSREPSADCSHAASAFCGACCSTAMRPQPLGATRR